MIPLIVEALEIRKAVKMAKAVKKKSKGFVKAAAAVKKAGGVGRNRPRVTIKGDTAVFGEKSPYKGRVIKANPGYLEHGATYDLFGGESRKIARKPKEYSRPRVRVHGKTVTFAKHSPFKGKVEVANPGARVVVAPCRIELSAADMRGRMSRGKPSAALISDILDMAAQSRKDWDHVEVTDARGKHLFDLV